MTSEELCAALGGLPDALILEAMESGQRAGEKVIPWKRLIACAAVLAVIIGALLWHDVIHSGVVEADGILTIKAYAADGVTSTIMEKGIELPFAFGWNSGLSSIPGLPLTLSIDANNYPDSKITFDICVEDGSFIKNDSHWISCSPSQNIELFKNDQPLGKSFVIDNQSTIFWTNHEISQNYNAVSGYFKGDKTYVDIIIKADDHIIGYAVIKIYCAIPAALHYQASVVETISYPLLDGKYQNIRLSDVQAAMNKRKEVDSDADISVNPFIDYGLLNEDD